MTASTIILVSHLLDEYVNKLTEEEQEAQQEYRNEEDTYFNDEKYGDMEEKDLYKIVHGLKSYKKWKALGKELIAARNARDDYEGHDYR